MGHICCFLPRNKTTPSQPIRDLAKRFNGYYIGIGTIFPHEHEQELKAICSAAHLPLHSMPMGSMNFAAFVDSYKLDFLNGLKQEKDLALRLLMREHDIQDISEAAGHPAFTELLEEIEDLTAAIQKRENAIVLQNAPGRLFQYESLLKTPSEQDIAEEIRKISPGIPTGFRLGDSELKLEGGEISVIAAPTGHGKTSFIINTLFGLLEHNPQSSVYLFSYEEARAPIICLALNCYLGERLSQNNRDSIKAYFRDGNVQYIAENMRGFFLEKKNCFFKELVQKRRLNVFYSSFFAEELVEAIRFLAQQPQRPTAICIDYMQLLRLKEIGKNASRQEELKQICLLLKDCAVETGLPILIAAQFNRTVQSEREMLAQAIGEAGDIERIAALILGLWNRKFGQERPEEAIYVKVLKGRNIPVGADVVLSFNGNACKIMNARQPQNDIF
ncbi:MAG: hypothetical protein HW387_1724 [Parachlamydiales bacterium]|nr:hypothetical protein [Parachlamydiales bacterium]